MQRKSVADKAPMFALRYLLTTLAQKNDKGTWYGPQFSELGFVEDEETYAAAKAFNEQVKSGGIKPPTRDAAQSPGGPTEPDDM
jgi:hypothetical protein